MNPPSAHRPPTTDHRPPSSVLRPRLGLSLGLGKSPAARGHPAAHLDLNLNQKPPYPPSHLSTFHLPLSAQSNIQNPKSKIPASLTPSPLNPLTPRRPRAAFTLIELMVAAGITTLLLLGMTGIFDQSMKAWQLSSRRADAEREVRAALAQIKRDLSCMVVNSNLPIAYNQSRLANTFINVASPGSFQLIIGNHPPKSGPQGQDWSNASVVLFFATTGGSSQGNSGDVSGVGYFVTWDTNSNQGRGAWNLYRRYQRPVDLLAGMQERIANPNRGPYHTNTLSEPELIGANVFNFFAQPVNILTNSGGTNTNMVTYASLQAGTNVTVRPKYMQLELTAYGSEQVRGFGKFDWFNTNNITKFGRSFIWRVDL